MLACIDGGLCAVVAMLAATGASTLLVKLGLKRVPKKEDHAKH